MAMPAGQVSAQNYPRGDIDLDSFVQDLFGFQDEDLNYEDLYETLLLLYTNPLNLNRASREQLQSLYVLNEAQINALLNHRDQHGKLLSIYELQGIDGFDLNTIYKLLPFAEVRDAGLAASPQPFFERLFQEENRYFFIRHERTLQNRRGYQIDNPQANRYLGSPDRLYARFRTSHSGDFSIGFTAEKDAGEQLVWDPATRRYGMDFWSAHAVLHNQGRFKTIAVGDYQLQVGQGLLLAAGFQIGKGAETVAAVRRATTGIRPYTSVLESGFFRGAAATYEAGPFDVTAFVSHRRLDANLAALADSADSFEEYVSTIYQTGFHRTPNEIRNKGQLPETTAGSHVKYRNRDGSFNTGFTLMNTQYATAFTRRPNNYNQFEFRGKNNFVAGLDVSYSWQNFSFFGEGARSESGGTGLVAGLAGSLSAKTDIAMLFRDYARDFHTFYGNAFGENSRNINERGMYWGIKHRHSRQWEGAAYFDLFRFPWLRFRADAPSAGHEALLRLNWAPSKTLGFFAQYRYQERPRNHQPEGVNVNTLAKATRQNFWLNLEYRPSKTLHVRSRAQFSSFMFAGNRTGGMVFSQDVNFDFGRLRLSARAAVFGTDDFENRQYVYEKDVLYAFSFPAYFGEGIRNYLLLQYRFNKHLDLWLRYANTRLMHQDRIGSGLDTIEGNRRSDVKAQIRVRF